MRWLTIGVLVITLAPSPGEACEQVLPDPYEVDPAQVGVDTTPPSRPAMVTFDVHRFDDGSACHGNSCEGAADLTIRLEGAIDDMTPSFALGVDVRVVSGTPPLSLALEEGTFFMGSDGTLSFPYDSDDSLDFTLAIRLVDKAGNVGDELLVEINDDPGGCSTAGGGRAPRGTGMLMPLAITVLALTVRRRRAPRRSGP